MRFREMEIPEASSGDSDRIPREPTMEQEHGWKQKDSSPWQLRSSSGSGDFLWSQRNSIDRLRLWQLHHEAELLFQAASRALDS